MTRLLLSWSGGKDAAWALRALRRRRDVEVVGLVTMIAAAHERIAMQGIRVDVLHAQARATGLSVIEARIPSPCDNATYEAAFADALRPGVALPAPSGVFPRHVEPEAA